MNILFATHLQSRHTPPTTPTNRERIAAYRALAPVDINHHEGEKYARAETLDGRYPTTEIYVEEA